MNKDRWNKLLVSCGMQVESLTYNQLVAAYSEAHRAYHTQAHISACIDGLDSCELDLQHRNELELAFWFHDAVYKIYSSTNEEDSADWAVRFLEKNECSKQTVTRVRQYILDTKHNALTNSLEASVVVDIDLAILGSSTNSYDVFEESIAREYKIVPRLIYKKKRKAVLESFIQKQNIYRTDYYRDRYESQARVNLRRAIDQLS